MHLFRTDLARNFAIGFAIGALVVVFRIAPDVLTSTPQAIAAPAEQAGDGSHPG